MNLYFISSPGSERIKGPVSFAHQYVDMTKEEVTLSDGTKATTCKPGMGYRFEKLLFSAVVFFIGRGFVNC